VVVPANRKISFVTATFHAREMLEHAAACLVAQTSPHWEMIVSPDDGGNYGYLTQRDSRIRVVSTKEKNTGAGPARNRGRAIATGDYIAVLDDDDTLAGNFVAQVMRALGRSDFVTVPTAYVRENGGVIREVGIQYSELDISRFAGELGSMHAICAAGVHPPWQDCFAEDVLHTCEAIYRAGGKIPVVGTTRYFGTIREGSTCATRTDIATQYEKLIELLPPTLTAAGAQQTKELFEYRRQVNAAFDARTRREIGYHEFVCSLGSDNFFLPDPERQSAKPKAARLQIPPPFFITAEHGALP
jgi:hypothetical protein